MAARTHAPARVMPLLVLSILHFVPVILFAQPRSEFYGVYMGARKLGWIANRSEDLGGEGSRRVRIQSESVLTVELMGTTVRQESAITTLCDEKRRPLSQEFRIESNGSVMKVQARYSERHVEVTVDAGGGTTKRTLAVPADGVLVADSTFLSTGTSPAIGNKTVVYYLNPLTITLDRAVVTVEVREPVTYDGKEHNAYRTSAKTPLGTIRAWEDPPGDVLWAELPLGMVMYRMSEETAKAADAAAPEHSVRAAPASGATAEIVEGTADLARATAVEVQGPVPSPRARKVLALELRGFPEGMAPPGDSRQQVKPVPGQPGAYHVIIRVPDANPSHVKLPIRSAAMRRYLGQAPYLDIGHPQIRSLAGKLRDAASAARTASRIRAWVHENMQPDYGIGVLRSSVDVLQRRRGVCRDYAMLFAALARAAGIPTRLVGGLIYADGRFYYHAWVECWVGRWVAYDATMPTDFVDATHVKLSQGDPTDMMRVYEVIGKLSARIVEAQL